MRNGVAELDGKVYSEMAGMVWRARRLRQKEIRGTYKKQPISNLVLSKPAMKSRTEPDWRGVVNGASYMELWPVQGSGLGRDEGRVLSIRRKGVGCVATGAETMV